MLDHLPDAQDLLDTALAAFRRDILPSLGDDHRFTGLMIANALSIARREIGRDEREEQRLATELATLLNRPAAALPTLLPVLAQAIEGGNFDAEPAAGRLHVVLLSLTETRLHVTNPKMLQSGT